MNFSTLNYRHLHYFWVVAKEGSLTRAAERLGVTVQTISGQLSQLERDLGKALLAPLGRGLTLTDAGRLALVYADQIFQLGEQMQDSLQAHGEDTTLRLTVGIVDALPKMVASRLLQGVLALPQTVRLVCYEGSFDELMADLALHKLDVVLTDRPLGATPNLRVFSHPLGEYEMSLFGAPQLAARYRDDFPASLNGAPLLLPTRNNALRLRLEQWLEARNLRPKVVGEFEDNALLNTFGRSGLGLFPAASALAAEVASQLQAERVGELAGVRDQFYAISNERRIRHPGVEAILQGISDA